jgi:serine/threonine-protein kinase
MQRIAIGRIPETTPIPASRSLLKLRDVARFCALLICFLYAHYARCSTRIPIPHPPEPQERGSVARAAEQRMNTIRAEQWLRLRRLLDEALELTGDARQTYLDSLHEEDSGLRTELSRLLLEHERMGTAAMPNAMEMAAPILGGVVREEATFDRERIGQSVGPYRLIRLLGAGGMGAVYLAERSADGFVQQVALKVVRRSLQSPTVHERFDRERRILSGLKHPGIALLFDGGRTDDGQLYYTMEFVEGEAITDYCASRQIAVAARVELLLQIASALAHAHRNLIVHRDIKPSNVLVDAAGHVKLVDFGLAKLLESRPDMTMTQAGMGPMTPAYAAPEQFRNDEITVATDVYQLGVLCFVILGGRLPYRADPDDALAWARAVTDEEPITLARAIGMSDAQPAAAPHKNAIRRRLTRDLDAILRKAMAKAPAERYRSMDALIGDFRAYLEGRPVSARRAGTGYFAWRFALRHRYAVAGTLLAFAILAATAMIAVRQARTAAREADRANTVANFVIGLFQVSDPAVNRGEKLSANEILQRGAERIDTAMASQPVQKAELQVVLGEIYRSLGDYPAAHRLLDRAISTLRSSHGDTHVLAHALRVAAEVGRLEGDNAKALALANEAEGYLSSIEPAVLEERALVHLARARAQEVLGDTARADADSAMAVDEIGRAGLGDSVSAAKIHGFRGQVLSDRGDPKEAMAQHALALDIFRERLGPDNVETLYEQVSVGWQLLYAGELDKSLALLEPAVAREREVLGDKSYPLAVAMCALGEAYRARGEFERSVDTLMQAKSILQTTVGEKHWRYAWALLQVGKTRAAAGDAANAIEPLEQSLSAMESSVPSDSPLLSEPHIELAGALIPLGRYAEAADHSRTAIDLLRAKLSPDHSEIVRALYQLGLARRKMGDRAGSKLAWDEALESAKRSSDGDSGWTKKLKADIAEQSKDGGGPP